jgi:hypothetical protein
MALTKRTERVLVNGRRVKVETWSDSQYQRATLAGWRLLAYREGGTCCQWHCKGLGWVLCDEHFPVPVHIERALCAALGVADEAAAGSHPPR